MHKFFLLLFLPVLVWGCRLDEVSPGKYMDWLADASSGLNIVNEGELFRYSVRYRPKEEMALIELGTEYTTEKLNSMYHQYEGLEYYLLKLESKTRGSDIVKTGLTKESDYYERLNYLTFNFQADIALVVGQDTSMCSLYHLERNYGSAPYLKVLLAFPAIDTGFTLDRKILIYPRIEQAPNILDFNIKSENFHKIPKLKKQN